MTLARAAIIVAFAIAGWLVCGAAIGVGFAVLTKHTALVVHAIVAPVAFAGLSYFYFTRFAYTTALATAAVFLAIVVALDVFVVALFVERSFAMFASVLGTWLPFALIFAATWTVGLAVGGKGQPG
ncbi:MAG: hypothetical protein ACLQIQ_07900 [Beijerinckiaceae bacterium]